MTTSTKRWQGWVVAAGALGLLSCGCGNKILDPPSVTKRALLQSFSGPSSCQDLEKYIEDTAVMEMRTELEAARDGVPSWGWWGRWRGSPPGEFEGGAVPTAGTGSKAAPTDYTTTNNQVAGVDEADFVKNDGTRIFVLSGEKLFAVKSWPAEQTAVQGSQKIEGWPREMFLDGADQAVVFSSVYTRYPLSSARGDSCSSIDCGYYSSNTVKVTVVDVSDMSNLRVKQEYYLPGSYNSARKVGRSVRLVLSDGFNFPSTVQWWPQNVTDWNDKAALAKAYDELIESNEQAIRSQTLAGWVPAATLVQNGQSTALPHACSDFAKVNAPTRLGTVSVVTIDLGAAPDVIGRTSIIAEPGEIYASTKNLYIATRHWWWWPAPGQKDTTYVHKFDISQPSAAGYVASGTVDGHIVDQFSMDENAAGFFRLATTIQTRVDDPADPSNWWGRVDTTNRVFVLGENSGSLEVVGATEELAKGERVMSSRFIENKAFVVTFRQIDPLFTFDMTDPTKPTKVGELKVPGFSTYLHPIDADHLLTIGTYVDPDNTNSRARALQLAIFDVSDLRLPKQTFVQLVGTAYGWSEAQYEHKAFNYFPAKKLLAIPFADWSTSSWSSNNSTYWSSFTSDLRVYGVDPAQGFTAKGAISMRDLYQSANYGNWSYFWTPEVRRSVMADDFAYAISSAGIRVANLSDLSVPLVTATFDRTVNATTP